MYTGEPRSSGSSTDDERANGMLDIIVTPEYQEWLEMRERCSNPRHPHYKDFGEIGARVCHEWDVSYSSFLRDMGPMPNHNRFHFLQRIDCTQAYFKENCQWGLRPGSKRRLQFQVYPSGNYDLLEFRRTAGISPPVPTTKHPSGETFEEANAKLDHAIKQRSDISTSPSSKNRCTLS